MYPHSCYGHADSFWCDFSSMIYIPSGTTFKWTRSPIVRCHSSHCPWPDYHRVDGENAGRRPLIRPSDCRGRGFLLRLWRLRFLWYTASRRAGENLIEAWISNCVYNTAWEDIIYPIPNFNSTTVEVWELINNFIPHFTGMWLIIHAGVKSIYVIKFRATLFNH